MRSLFLPLAISFLPLVATAAKSSGNETNASTGQPATSNGVTLLNPLGSGASLPSLLTSILQLVVEIGSIVVILMLVYVGFKFVAARGEPGKITEARQMLLWTIVGALILLGAEAIAQGIQATVGALSTGS
ncbi:hypothetical protein HY091_02135 [Candidatus Kaiserbacteria bacterium]|nr:hypothetical protein [Candidatus Kaiserbacteria bacterium]